MKTWLKFEELGMFILGLYLFSSLDFQWWIFAVLFFLPDLSMVGYALSNRTGAVLYNIFHHKGVAIVWYLVGLIFMSDWVQLMGLVLFSHSAFDRILGYGLKLDQGFQFTHLGKIGRN